MCGYYIPNRLKQGYGLNKEAIKQIVEEKKITLMITVDCRNIRNRRCRICKFSWNRHNNNGSPRAIRDTSKWNCSRRS